MQVFETQQLKANSGARKAQEGTRVREGKKHKKIKGKVRFSTFGLDPALKMLYPLGRE